MKWHGGTLQCLLLSEGSQYENAIFYMMPTIRHSRKDKTMVTVKRSVVVGDSKLREAGMKR